MAHAANEYGAAPMNLVFSGARAFSGRNDFIDRAWAAVTRLWYIREFDPYEKIMTGMTRDGLFFDRKRAGVSSRRAISV